MVILFSIFFGLLPSFIWLVFFLKEDEHPEPKKMLLKVFALGMVFALATVIFQNISLKSFSFFEIQRYGTLSFFVLALIEEIAKFLAAYLVVKKSGFFDEPVDAMIYMITAAMGFAAMENIFIAAGDSAKEISGVQILLGILVLRFVGATLLHALSSSVVGYYWAKGLLKIGNWKLKIVRGLAIAAVLHAIFNLLILKYSPLAIYPMVFLIIIALIVFWDFEKVKKRF